MAFESLTEKFSAIFKKLRGQARLTESNMDEMLKEVRVALLEADVNFKVVKSFINGIKEKALGQDVLSKLNPSQMVVKIVHEELERLLGSENQALRIKTNDVTVIMLVGLQGSGKTTTAGKLAYYFKNKLHKKVLLSACDVYRPAAIDQLCTVARQTGVDVVNMGTKESPVTIAKASLDKAKLERYDVLIIDTAGRLSIDEPLMQELKDIQDNVSPYESLLLVDAMSGQDAVNVAKTFNEKIELTGIVMSKLDGDSRGGSALSIKELTGLPIKFCGLGEKFQDFDVFHPDRMADRILGMGDVMTLVEKAQEELDEKQMKKTVSKMMDGTFTLDDMMDQLRQIKKLGSIGFIAKLIPGMPSMTDDQKDKAEEEMKNCETIINSMTKEERIHPEILKNSRKVRIANGCGKTNADINRLLKKYEQMKDLMKKMKGMKNGRIPPGMMNGGLGGMF